MTGATARNPRRGRCSRAFTLIELLTVIAIITLLIGIVTPALNRARVQAQRTAVRATLQAIETGNEMFRNDNNEYAKSNVNWYALNTGTASDDYDDWEVWDGTNRLNGANLIVDAMVGRDLIGHDAKRGTGPGNDSNSRWFSGTGSTRSRGGPYVKVEGITTSNLTDRIPKDINGDLDVTKAMPTIDGIAVPVFLDKWGFPVLYYRAKPNAGTQVPILHLSTLGAEEKGNGVYDGRDNAVFTTPTSPPTPHLIADAPVGLTAGDMVGANNQFVQFIRSIRSSSYDTSNNVTFARPVNSESFILLSPGPDGRWGNNDDVGNFEVLSESR